MGADEGVDDAHARADLPEAAFESVVSLDPTGRVTWRFEREFLTSRWHCIWGKGCQGILDEARPDLHQGCCSLGAELLDDDEARLVATMASLLGPAEFEHQRLAQRHGVFRDETMRHTALVDDACIFFNRPGFAGGAGCALHLAAVARGESPIDWKPTICWQVPVRIEWVDGPDGSAQATVRRWRRHDWGPGGAGMAWCCTEPGEAPDAYDGPSTVLESLAEELSEIAGDEVVVELRRRLS